MNRAQRLIRAPLALLPRGLKLPILNGPAVGMKWTVGSGTHGRWIGSYERRKVGRLAAVLRAGMTFYDLGANVGYYTLVGARLVGPSGLVVAFEPLSENRADLERHVALNSLDNVRVLPYAVLDETGWVAFDASRHRSMARVDVVGTSSVPAVSLDGWVEGGGSPPPDVIKIDVEGSEDRVLMGARRTLEDHRPALLISTHGWRKRKAVTVLLEDAGYTVERTEVNEFVAVPGSSLQVVERGSS